MCTEFGEKLQEAMNSINSSVWVNKDGSTVKMIDMPADELQNCAKHCWEMLYNDDTFNVGRVIVKRNLQKAWDSCNTELFVRYLLHECDTELKTRKDLLDYINSCRNKTEENIIDSSISVIFGSLSPIFEKVTIRKLMDACFDKLDVFNRKVITDKFLLSQGIWLTDQEKIDLTEKDETGKARDKKVVICERLSLNKINPRQIRFLTTGFSYNEFRSIVQMPMLAKISSLPSNTLVTLRDKVILLIDNELDYHINKWSKLLKNIMEVADRRKIPLELPNIPKF